MDNKKEIIEILKKHKIDFADIYKMLDIVSDFEILINMNLSLKDEMYLPEKTLKALQYIRKNPKAKQVEISKHIDSTEGYTSKIIYKLREMGLLSSK
jgi:DNA-binding MarR family transcriptional regulator